MYKNPAFFHNVRAYLLRGSLTSQADAATLSLFGKIMTICQTPAQPPVVEEEMIASLVIILASLNRFTPEAAMSLRAAVLQAVVKFGYTHCIARIGAAGFNFNEEFESNGVCFIALDMVFAKIRGGLKKEEDDSVCLACAICLRTNAMLVVDSSMGFLKVHHLPFLLVQQIFSAIFQGSEYPIHTGLDLAGACSTLGALHVVDGASYEKARMRFTMAGVAMVDEDRVVADSVVCLVLESTDDMNRTAIETAFDTNNLDFFGHERVVVYVQHLWCKRDLMHSTGKGVPDNLLDLLQLLILHPRRMFKMPMGVFMIEMIAYLPYLVILVFSMLDKPTRSHTHLDVNELIFFLAIVDHCAVIVSGIVRSTFFVDAKDYLDVVLIFSLVVAFVFRYRSIELRNDHDALLAGGSCADHNSATMQAVSVYDGIKSVAAVAMFLRVLFFLRVRRSFGMFFSILQGMLATVYVYVGLVTICVVGFALSIYVLFNTDVTTESPRNDSFSTLSHSFSSLLETILGSYAFSWFDFYNHEDNYALFYALTAVLFTFIVVMLTIVRPAFTAIIIETYARLKSQARLAYLASFAAIVCQKSGRSVKSPGTFLICICCTTIVVFFEGIFTCFFSIRDVIRIRAIKRKAQESMVLVPAFDGNAPTDLSEVEDRARILEKETGQKASNGEGAPGAESEGGQVTMPGAYWFCAYCHARNGYYTKKTMAARIEQWGAKMQIAPVELSFVSPCRLYCFECMRTKNGINYFQLRFRQMSFGIFLLLFWPPCVLFALPWFLVLKLVTWLVTAAESNERERINEATLRLCSKRTESWAQTTALIDTLSAQTSQPTLADVHSKIAELEADVEAVQALAREARMKLLEEAAALDALRENSVTMETEKSINRRQQ
jgi:hypothetical protein